MTLSDNISIPAGSRSTFNDQVQPFAYVNVEVLSVPEPETWALTGLGLVSAMAAARWQRKQQEAQKMPGAMAFGTGLDFAAAPKCPRKHHPLLWIRAEAIARRAGLPLPTRLRGLH